LRGIEEGREEGRERRMGQVVREGAGREGGNIQEGRASGG